MGERGSALKEGSGRGKKEGGWGNKKRISSSLGFFVVVLFCFFCIHLRVAIGEPLHTRMVKIWHTHTQANTVVERIQSVHSASPCVPAADRGVDSISGMSADINQSINEERGSHECL